MNILQMPRWALLRAYANGVVAQGRMVSVSGMIVWDGQSCFHTDDFAS